MINLDALWYQKRVFWLLIPFSLIFSILVKIRRNLYRYGILKADRFPVTVIVVGNLTIGGTGKTPLVIHIAHLLKNHGLRVGIVSRGYKGQHRAPTWVYSNSDPTLVGDEAALCAQQVDCPIVVGRQRGMAVRYLLQSNTLDVVISDDGLQHYALARDIEIVVIDGQRRFGNRYCLPAGPLREPENRLETVDLRVVNGGKSSAHEYAMRYLPAMLYNPYSAQTRSLESFAGETVHAIAGIGNPSQFFQLLRDYGLIVIEHAYPDHHRLSQREIYFKDTWPVILTEKDAVKCKGFWKDCHWILPVNLAIDPLFDARLLTLLQGVKHG